MPIEPFAKILPTSLSDEDEFLTDGENEDVTVGEFVDEEDRRPEIIKQIEAVKSVFSIRYNTILARSELYNKKAKIWEPIDDVIFNTMYMALLKAGLKISEKRLQVILVNRSEWPLYDPFADYFASLPKWDGQTDYIGQLAACVTLSLAGEKIEAGLPTFGEAWTRLFRRWLIASVSCALGKTVNDVCLTFIGEQGIGKTTFLYNICPPQLRTFMHTGHIEPSLKEGATCNLLAEKWFVNIDDQLDIIFGRDAGSMKSIISAPSVGNRKAFARFDKTRTRVASFMASVNKTQFLSDTSNRRYFCVEAKEIGRERPDADKVWAQAYALLQAGERPYFDKEETAIIEAINTNYAETTPEQELLAIHFQPLTKQEYQQDKYNARAMTATEILKFLSDRAGTIRLYGHVMARALKRLGFQKHKVRRKGELYPLDCYLCMELSEAQNQNMKVKALADPDEKDSAELDAPF